ncbi:uncharacterized protein LOC121778423 [Salvia splendens]|uniref:uncharacterized protein LOC121778423 n=1 Tax=Salvia splendens TaxID=180675 RepID=UPI001C262484|nr:uncharacterized protein LOC121778423 [Salvia splendens]
MPHLLLHCGSMTSRLATSAMRCLSLRRGVRSSIYISAAEARFVRRNLEEIDPRQLKPWDIERELAKPPAYNWPSDHVHHHAYNLTSTLSLSLRPLFIIMIVFLMHIPLKRMAPSHPTMTYVFLLF